MLILKIIIGIIEIAMEIFLILGFIDELKNKKRIPAIIKFIMIQLGILILAWMNITFY